MGRHRVGSDEAEQHPADQTELSGYSVPWMSSEEIGGEIEASIPWEIKHAEDIALMAQMGVRWEPNDECED